MDDVRIADLKTFLAVARSRSISAAARQLRVTPSQVSKAIVRLEAHTGTRLLARGARGITLTEQGRELVPRVTGAITAIQEMRRARAPQPLILTVAGPSYLIAQLLPHIATSDARLHVKGLELAPPLVRAHLTDDLFDIALLSGKIGVRPAMWTSDSIGSLRVALLGTRTVAAKLAPLPAPVARVRPMPFVAPLSSQPLDRYVALDDGCPLRTKDRIIAHQVETIGAALEMATMTSTLVFSPVIAARRFLDAGLLVEIPVEGWSVSEDLYLLCNGARVLAPIRTVAVRAVRTALQRLDPS